MALRSRRLVLVGLSFSLVIALVSTAYAFYGFTGTVGYADSSVHTFWHGSETNLTERAYWGAKVADVMQNEYDAKTDLTDALVTYHDTTDVQWVAWNMPSPLGGSASCNVWVNQSTRVCDHFHLNFDTDSASENQRRQAVCHEIAHSVGFDDYTSSNPPSGCTHNGPNGTLDSHEIFHINARY